MSVKKVVLTGGPCAGKTKTLDYVKKRLKDEGKVPINNDDRRFKDGKATYGNWLNFSKDIIKELSSTNSKAHVIAEARRWLMSKEYLIFEFIKQINEGITPCSNKAKDIKIGNSSMYSHWCN